MTPREDAPAPLDPVPEPHTGLIGRFRNYFLTGLVVTGPIAITLYLVWWFVTWVDGVVRPFVPLSQSPNEDVSRSLPGQEEHVSVFLPCSPNPTTGFFFYVPKSKIVEVDMSTEDAATLIMSAGVVQPGSTPDPKKAAALAGMANAARIANASALQPQPAKVE